jgi:hypothetical protein
MPMVVQPILILPELRKMDHRLFAVREKNKMTSLGCSRNGLATIGISLPSERDMPRNFGEEAES